MMTGEGHVRCRAVENPRAGSIQVKSSREEQNLLLFVLVWAQQGGFDSFWIASLGVQGACRGFGGTSSLMGMAAKVSWVRRNRTCTPLSSLNLGGVLAALPKSVPRPVAINAADLWDEGRTPDKGRDQFCWSRGNTDSRKQG